MKKFLFIAATAAAVLSACAQTEDGLCECPRCRKQEPEKSVAEMFNAMAAAVKAADPYRATCEALRTRLPRDGSFTVFSIGKAAIPMARAAAPARFSSFCAGE